MELLEGIKILIGPSSFAVYDQSPLNRLIEEGCEVIDNPFKRKLTQEELIELLSDKVTGLIAGLEPLNRQVLEKTKLKVISRCGSGMSNVDLAAAQELGIKVYSTPTAPVEAVAELTLAALLSLMRMVPQMNNDLHLGKWNKRIGVSLKGKTVVIIGFGRIGRRVSELLSPFRVRIIVVDPCLKDNLEGIETLPLQEALVQADIVTIHCSGKEQILGKDEFRFIKEGSFLLNAARGGVVEEEALVCALDTGKIRGAWLDTFDEEPYSGALSKFSQVLLTPHVGSYTVECRKSMEMEAVDNLISAFKE